MTKPEFVWAPYGDTQQFFLVSICKTMGHHAASHMIEPADGGFRVVSTLSGGEVGRYATLEEAKAAVTPPPSSLVPPAG